MNLEFLGKTLLVTGGGSGIGKAVCMAFAAAGAKVACVDRNAREGNATVEAIRALGREALFIAAEATKPYKYGCHAWEGEEEIEKAASTMLIEQYSHSSWAAKLLAERE